MNLVCPFCGAQLDLIDDNGVGVLYACPSCAETIDEIDLIEKEDSDEPQNIPKTR